MQNKNLGDFLLNLFQEDFNRNDKFTYISQMAIITEKSLLPMVNEEGVRIDYKRYEEEYRLWTDYRIGENNSLIYGKSNIYWEEKDDSIIPRILPILIANQNYDIIEEEVIKNTLYTTGNIQRVFETLSISYVLYLILNDIDHIGEKLKEKVMDFSQNRYMDKYKRYYRDEYPGNFKVEFEREKIFILNLLNGVSNNRYKELEDVFKVIEREEPTTLIGKALYKFLFVSNIKYDLPSFYLNLGEYIMSLRKSRIDPEKLKIKEYVLPDVFSFKEGELFFHSLLKEAKIIKKEVRENTQTSLVQTKTGMYLFRR